MPATWAAALAGWLIGATGLGAGLATGSAPLVGASIGLLGGISLSGSV